MLYSPPTQVKIALDNKRGRKPIIVVVCSAVVEKQGSFLLIKELKPAAANKWGLPGGKLEEDESIVGCLRREVKEETGHEVTSEKLICIINKPTSSEGNTVIKFVFKCDIGAEQQTAAEHEFEFLPLATLEDLANKKLVRGDEIVPLLKKVASGYDPDYSDLIQTHD